MTERVNVDVVVVGLGAFGSAALYQLARHGVRALGIDRFTPPHTLGSSHGETRITRLAVGEGDDYAPIVRRSHDIWRELEEESGKTLMLQTGGLIMSPRHSAARHHGRENFVRRTLAVAEQFGIAHEKLDAAEIQARFPQFVLRGDELGYYEPTAGMLIPETCVETQLRLAETHGATLRLEERVVAVEQKGGGVVVETDKASISAERCVLAVGPWLSTFMPTGLRPLVKVYRQTLHWFEVDDPASFAPGRFPVFIWMHGEREEDYLYGFPMSDAGHGLKVATETYEITADPHHVDRVVTPGESAKMFAEHVAGRVRGVRPEVTRSAACLYTVTPDAGFIVDRLPGQDRIVVISACSGHGFKHSAAVGEAVAELVAEGRSAIDLAPFGLHRFDGSMASSAAAGG